MGQIRVGVIGCGYWGPNLIRNFISILDSDVVMVADKKPKRLAHIQGLYPGVKITENYEDLFAEGLDAVVIATPPSSHYVLAKECLEHDLHVMVEKPLTLISEHAEELIVLAEERGSTLMVGHTFQYNPAVDELKKLVHNGELGDVYYIDAARLNLGLYQRNMNALWDLAPHDISILLHILEEMPTSVQAFGSSSVFDGVHDVVYANLTFPSSIIAHVHVSWLDPCKVRRVTVVGSQKMAVYNDVVSHEKIKIYDRGIDAHNYVDSFEEFQFDYRYGDILIPHIRYDEPLRIECQHFLDCIVNHEEPISNGRIGLNVVRIMEAAQHSLMNGGDPEPVTIDLPFYESEYEVEDVSEINPS